MKTVSLNWLVPLVLALGLAGCAGKVPLLSPAPTVVRLQIAADAAVNPDAHGRPTPVVVRYYLLGNPGAFESADFFSLFDSDEKTLGATLVSREEITLRPGETRASELKPQTEVKSVGVFVAFRDVNKTVWRATAPVPQNKTTTFAVSVQRDKVSIVAQPR